MEDDLILRLFFDRDERAIEQVAEKYGYLCRSIANAVLDSREDCEECLNDTYLQLWENIPPARPDNLRAYVCRIARCRALDRYRRNNRKKRGRDQLQQAASELEESFADSGFEGGLIDSITFADVVNRFLRELPQRERVVFVRRYWFFDSIREIADRTDLKDGTVKRILFQCRNKLAEYLKKEELQI